MTRRRTLARELALLALLGVVLAAGFAWGYLAHRDQIFPYRLAWNLAVEAGRIEPSRSADEMTVEVSAADAAVRSLSYVAGTADPHAERSGVYLHDTDRAFPGFNLYAPRRPQALLLAMDGTVVHRWRARSGPWVHVELLDGGGLLAMVKDERLLRLDADSNLLWTREGNFHHDLWVDGDGRIHVLDRTYDLRPEVHPVTRTVVDRVTVLSSDGEPVGNLPILDLIQASPYAFLLPDVRARGINRTTPTLDVLHANHVEVFDGRLAHLSPLFREGNLLLSLRTINTILIADPDAGEVLWAWGPSNLVVQHHPTLLDDGHLLIFNNGVGRSEVIELDPLADRVVWRYTADDFHSPTRGSVQRLPNGNTLITESDTGYVFEVTPEGERVWAFANPVFTGDGKRGAIWRMTRFAAGDARLPPAVTGAP